MNHRIQDFYRLVHVFLQTKWRRSFTKNWCRGTEKPGNFEMAEPIQGRTGGNGHREFRQIGFALGLRKQLFHFAYWLNQ